MDMTFLTLQDTQAFARTLGEKLKGGEVIELVGDVGTGKTTFTKGLALGLGVTDDVQSPSFTISRTYVARDGLTLQHYDFYRLPDAGIMAHDVAESAADQVTVTVIEWAETVADVLPSNRTVITFRYGQQEEERQVAIQSKVTGIEEAYAAWTQN